MGQKPKALTILDWITGILFITAILGVFFYAPLEAVMGWVQKVFYFHVAAGWTGMLGFLVSAVAGVLYLVKKDPRWDRIGFAGVEIGMVFMLICIITGSIWARPIWNTWWTWDPRLTTATIMELIYAAYLLLRQGVEEPDRRARFGAVYAIIGFISVPLTFLSIRIFRTIHPVVIGSNDPGAAGAFDMTPRMMQVFMFSLVAFSFIFADILWHRIRLGALADHVEQKKIQLQTWGE
ncbi:MAG TPA: cytochrome c biogenesis protein CcsA [Anaerolineaceae bacterium]|nr:cytochrome c biogenesis protein CcsA [Anaerolineaceae bacterium]HQF44481.1 cytochrome c biogenesis protein CcsA [Anaerolineaceae bacterium]HQH34368.1 cytochrome c biogenesis protein CcsA [Anaerolineaceae bacterium]HQJ02505.1 cytochrome c biogenesis protein CcsA [Anaerolineaceae bacterium]